jgi:hypothetical protein
MKNGSLRIRNVRRGGRKEKKYLSICTETIQAHKPPENTSLRVVVAFGKQSFLLEIINKFQKTPIPSTSPSPPLPPFIIEV